MDLDQTVSIGYGCLNVVAGYLLYLSSQPPSREANTKPAQKDAEEDSVSSFAIFVYSNLGSPTILLLSIWQGLYIATKGLNVDGIKVAPEPDPQYPLNQTIMTPNLVSVPLLLTICAGACLRLQAYRSLGPRFTFYLQQPQKLKTDGLYRWMQHPAYTGVIFSLWPAVCWYLRWDNIMGTLIPSALRQFESFMNYLIPLSFLVYFLTATKARAQHEENMLKKKFGKEWEEYNHKTARFVPGVY